VGENRIRLPSGTVVAGPTEMIRRFLSLGGKSVEDRVPPPPREPIRGRKTRVLAVVHGWLPYLAAGSERMIQHMIDALPRDEFEVTVLSLGFSDDRLDPTPYEYEGTPVYVGFSSPNEPDIIITHHGPASRVTLDLTREFPEARVIAVYHNDRFDIADIQRLHSELEVFNTEWVRDSLDGEGLVVRPPLEYDRHHVDRIGHKVTLVNLQDNKGVATFQEMARRMPDVEFLGVEGTHGIQKKPPYPNVEYRDVTQDMREVWTDTALVLMPSEYESYGMVAAEACASGIPVLAHPTPGLVECLGGAGLFLDRDDYDRWEQAIRLLLSDAEIYRERSETSALHGEFLAEQAKRELDEFVQAVRRLV
jgi:hypothetical protein